jgi:hypothetical protein
MPEISTVGRVLFQITSAFSEAQNSVLSRALSVPPLSAADGARYIVAPHGTGTWAGNDGAIATYNASSFLWNFLMPEEGTAAWVDDEDRSYTFNGTAWVTSSATGASRPTLSNKAMPALTTARDGDLACAIGLSESPTAQSYLRVEINGIGARLGNATKSNAECYFSHDGGATARAWTDIALSDTLHWQGSIAGFELAPTDTIDIVYGVTS